MFGTSQVMKVVMKFHQTCVCSFWEESKYLFWGATPSPIDPLDLQFFNGVNNRWYTMDDDVCGEFSSELHV